MSAQAADAASPGRVYPARFTQTRKAHVAATPSTEGIINPPIDDLLQVVDSKYGLVIMASKRARQINAYYAQLGEGLLEYVGPLVETRVQEKPLSIALREISERLLSAELPPVES
jgi:DNA-directed RNA polymerase subunit omega